jgi:hypothetical protein
MVGSFDDDGLKWEQMPAFCALALAVFRVDSAI